MDEKLSKEEQEKLQVRALTADYLEALKGGIAERERLIDNLSLLTAKSEARIDTTNQMISKLSDVLDRISGEYVKYIDVLSDKREADQQRIADLTASVATLTSCVEGITKQLEAERERNRRIEKAFIDLVQQVAHPAINNTVSTRQVNLPKEITDKDL